MARISRVRDINQLVEDIKRDVEKINKDFNKQIEEKFKKAYSEEADAWYERNTPKTTDYERTNQLKERALLITKIEGYDKKITFSASKIKPKRGKLPVERMGQYGVWVDHTGTLPSYYSWKKNNGQLENISAEVLEWEEMGYNNFRRYGYGKGNGIWGMTLKKVIEEIDSIKIDKSLKLYAPTQIIEDLFNLLKSQTKKNMQERYKEMFM